MTNFVWDTCTGMPGGTKTKIIWDETLITSEITSDMHRKEDVCDKEMNFTKEKILQICIQ